MYRVPCSTYFQGWIEGPHGLKLLLDTKPTESLLIDRCLSMDGPLRQLESEKHC